MKTIIYNFFIIFLLLLISPIYGQAVQDETQKKYHLIAHRGGVVDNRTAENSLASLKKASQEDYWMVEVDLRLTRDSVLIIHHDPNFKRYYGTNKTVSEMDWDEVKELKGDLDNKVLSFEEALKFCQESNLQVMVDNKIDGYDSGLFAKVVALLKKYERLEDALMIGTDESTPYFTGKVKLSCTRQQLEDNMLKPDFNPRDYYLFSRNISKADVEWTRKHGILAVGVINAWAFKGDDKIKEAHEEVKRLLEAGVDYYQIDSIFGFLFM
jgi:glycerophosphoryl diester phosphodiesterase